MDAKRKAYLQLHIAVILFGFTAILGDLISLPAISLVWWRVLITCVSIFFIVNIRKTIKNLPRNILLRYMGIGLLVGLHWVSFYGVIKISSASVALVTISTASFFTAVFEPFFSKSQVGWLEVCTGLLMIPGMYIIFSDADTSMINGFLLGVFSAFVVALFSVFNKMNIHHADDYTITFIELGTACIGIGILLLGMVLYGKTIAFVPPALSDWVYIIILSLLCTTLAYSLSLRAMNQLSAFDTSLAINLEPVYGIVLAAAILREHEQLNPSFYIGSFIIVIAVFLYPILKRRAPKSSIFQ